MKLKGNQERVRTYLRSGQLRIGDRLPGERSLAATLGIGRAALRSVLDQLEQEGVLIRRPQSGTFLAAVPLPAYRSLSVTLIGPLTDTRQTARVAEPAWIHRVVSAFERTVTPADVRLTLRDQTPAANDPCSLTTLLQQTVEEGAQAIILIHPLGDRGTVARALAMLHDRGIPSIIISSRDYSGLANRVYFDSAWGAYLATRHLLNRGHRRIGFAGSPAGPIWLQDRLKGYREALEAMDVTGEACWVSLSPEKERLALPKDGAEALRHFLSVPREMRPTGIVAANDIVALGFLAEAEKQGIEIPVEFSVVGFDNDPDALFKGLTTIERPTEALGEAAARLLLERMSGTMRGETITLRLRPVLIERRTVTSPP